MARKKMDEATKRIKAFNKFISRLKKIELLQFDIKSALEKHDRVAENIGLQRVEIRYFLDIIERNLITLAEGELREDHLQRKEALLTRLGALERRNGFLNAEKMQAILNKLEVSQVEVDLLKATAKLEFPNEWAKYQEEKKG